MTACMHSGLLWSSDLLYLGNHIASSHVFKYQDRKLYKECTEKGDFLERLNFGPISTPCILGTVTDRQNHLHITFRDINEKYKEENIHQHCMKNEHPHTKTKQTLFISLEPLVSVVDF